MKPKVIKYCNYKYFCNYTFRESLQNIFSQNLKNNYNYHCDNFSISCKNALDKNAPLEKEVCEGKSFAIYEQSHIKSNCGKNET